MAQQTASSKKPTANGAQPPDHEIAIIGAGLSGIGVGVALVENGFTDFAIFERKADLGGVWRDNTYPGVGVDIPSLAYQFDFLMGSWSRMYAKGHEVKAYVDQVADHFGVREHIHFESPVSERRWNEETHCWELVVNGEIVTARWVISAIGNFPMARDPQLAGLKDFKGKVLHSTDWDHEYSLHDKRVAVIGTGASGVQLIPEIAKVADHLTVFQRTPVWVIPKLDPKFGRFVQTVFRRYPSIQSGLQRRVTKSMTSLISAWVEFEKPSVRRPVHAVTWLLREGFYRRHVPDAALREKLTPQYGLLCKRPCLSSNYLPTFNRPNVELVTDSIETLTDRGIRSSDGREHEFDAIVLATGFYNAHDPEPYIAEPVVGADGFDLATFFAEETIVCYQGVTIPGLPNNLIVSGPYSATGGTWHDVIKVTGIHAVRLLNAARERGATRVEVRQEPATEFSEWARERLRHSLFQLNSCENANSYYFDRNGETPFLRPSTWDEALDAHTNFPLSDYRFDPLGAGEAAHSAGVLKQTAHEPASAAGS